MAEPASGGRIKRDAPAELVDGWPNEASVDPAVETARRLAINLRDALGGTSVRTVAAASHLNYTTIYAVLNGTTWPDLMTVARLEAGLDVDLWPRGVAKRARRLAADEQAQ